MIFSPHPLPPGLPLNASMDIGVEKSSGKSCKFCKISKIWKLRKYVGKFGKRFNKFAQFAFAYTKV
jgi:hypothetical protein